jgi:hypothetical protein
MEGDPVEESSQAYPVEVQLQARRFVATFLSFDSKEPLDVLDAVSRISQGGNLADSGNQESWGAAGAT